MNKRDTTTINNALGIARAILLADRHNRQSTYVASRAEQRAMAKAIKTYDDALARIEKAQALLQDPGSAAIKGMLAQGCIGIPAGKATKGRA